MSRSTLELTHYGRRTGKEYTVQVWFAEIDGKIWIGSLNPNASWVRNLRAAGRGLLDFGSGPAPYRCYWVLNARELTRFAHAIMRKHPIMSRLIRILQRGGRPTAFRCELEAGQRRDEGLY